MRIGDHVPQRPERNVWPLRQKQAALERTLHAPMAERPDAGKRAEQGGLAGTRAAGDDDGMAGLQHQVRVGKQLRAVRQLERGIAHLHRSLRRIGQHQPCAERGARGDDGTMERGQSLDDGVPLGQVGIPAR